MLAVQVGSYMGLDDAYAAFFANNNAMAKFMAKVCIKTDRYARTTRLPDDPAIRAAFDDVQSLWDNPVFCFHQDPSRPLFCDVDTSGRGIGVVWYHVTGDPEPTMEDSDIPDGYEDDASNPTSWLKRVKNLPKASIEPIMFASKVLSPPETRYMPTELEMAGVAWAVRKAKHLVGGAPKT